MFEEIQKSMQNLKDQKTSKNFEAKSTESRKVLGFGLRAVDWNQRSKVWTCRNLAALSSSWNEGRFHGSSFIMFDISFCFFLFVEDVAIFRVLWDLSGVKIESLRLPADKEPKRRWQIWIRMSHLTDVAQSFFW